MTIAYKLEGQTIFDLEKFNYCILRETIGENNYKYYYYFINGMTYDSANQFIIRLECDVMQTYYIDCTFAPCLINRAHLDRWKPKQGNTVTFNNAPDSPMLIPENSMSFSKYCTLRTRLVLAKRSATDPIVEWLNNNVEAWVYIFLQRTNVLTTAEGQDPVVRKYNVHLNTGQSVEIELPYIAYDDGSGHIRSEERYFTVLCYPIYRKGSTNKIAVRADTQGGNATYTTIDSFSEQYFNGENKDTSYYISKQVSRIPPFTTFGVEDTDYEISGGNLIIKSQITGDTGLFSSLLGCNWVITHIEDAQARTYRGLLSPTVLWTQIGLVPENFSGFKVSYDVSEIIGADFNPTLNPKMMSATFGEITISNEAGAQFSYDLQKMDNGELFFIYSEYVAPCGVSRGYLRLLSGNGDYGVYTPASQSNLTGLSFVQDTNLNYANNQLANYLANNRNFQTQISMKLGQNAFNTVWGAVKDIATTVAGGKARGATSKQQAGALAQERTGSSFDLMSSVVNTAFDMQNLFYSLDNMKGAPDILATANGSIMFNSTYSEIGLYLEVYACINTEALREAQRMQLFGFNYKMLGDIKDFDNLRKYFNFVSANISSAVFYDGSDYVGLPTPILNIMKNIFDKGVRFWNVAKTGAFMYYSKDNYELNLEE